MERGAETSVVFVADGRIVSAVIPASATRIAGALSEDDPPPLRRAVSRADHHPSGERPDLEDLLLTGGIWRPRTWPPASSARSSTRSSSSPTGNRFVPLRAGDHLERRKLVKLSIEGALIETARRVDERKRQRATFPTPSDPRRARPADPDERCRRGERAIRHHRRKTHLAEILAAAPLTEYETLEALHRMMEATWVEFVGRANPVFGRNARSALVPARESWRASGRRAARAAWSWVGGRRAVHEAAGRGARRPRRRLHRRSGSRPPAEARTLSSRQGSLSGRLAQLVEDGWVKPAT